MREKQINFCVAISKNKGILSGVCDRAVSCHPPRHSLEVNRAIQAAGAVRQHQWAVSLPVEPENPLRTAEITPEDDLGMIDGIINHGRCGKEREKAQDEAHRTTPETKPSIRERPEDAKRDMRRTQAPDQKELPEHDL